MNAPIVLLSDFGLRDAYVGVMKGVILSRNPAATLVDLCHGVPPQDIRRGAFLLATSVPYFPPGTIFLAVVDPGVGTERRTIALEAGDWRFVAPDNGLLAWTLRFQACDGKLALDEAGGQLLLREGGRAVELTERRFWRPGISTTFHGRDLFGPVAAELSLGRPLDELGRPLDTLVDLLWPESRPESNGALVGEVVSLDTYGNLITNLRPAELPANPIFEIAGQRVPGLSTHFQSQARLVAVVGSSGFVEIAAPNASAAAVAGGEVGSSIRVSAG